MSVIFQSELQKFLNKQTSKTKAELIFAEESKLQEISGIGEKSMEEIYAIKKAVR